MSSVPPIDYGPPPLPIQPPNQPGQDPNLTQLTQTLSLLQYRLNEYKSGDQSPQTVSEIGNLLGVTNHLLIQLAETDPSAYSNTLTQAVEQDLNTPVNPPAAETLMDCIRDPTHFDLGTALGKIFTGSSSVSFGDHIITDMRAFLAAVQGGVIQ